MTSFDSGFVETCKSQTFNTHETQSPKQDQINLDDSLLIALFFSNNAEVRVISLRRNIVQGEIKRPLQNTTPYITLAHITRLKQETTSTKASPQDRRPGVNNLDRSSLRAEAPAEHQRTHSSPTLCSTA
jgi:hypothetical protein